MKRSCPAETAFFRATKALNEKTLTFSLAKLHSTLKSGISNLRICIRTVCLGAVGDIRAKRLLFVLFLPLLLLLLPRSPFFRYSTMSNPDYEKDLGFEDKDLSDTNVVTKGAPREFGQIDEGMQEGTDLHR